MSILDSVVAKSMATLKLLTWNKQAERSKQKMSKHFKPDFADKVWTVAEGHPHDHLYVDCAVKATWSEHEMAMAFEFHKTGNIAIIPDNWKYWQFHLENSSDWVLVVLPPERLMPVVLATGPKVAQEFFDYMKEGLDVMRSYMGS